MSSDIVLQYALGNVKGKESIVTIGRKTDFDDWWVCTSALKTFGGYNPKCFDTFFFAKRCFKKLVKTYALIVEDNLFDLDKFKEKPKCKN